MGCRYLSLDNFSPGELLDKLCNETFKYHANVVLYVEFQNDNPSSTEYLLQVINFLGIPVMAFIGESSSLVKVFLLRSNYGGNYWAALSRVNYWCNHFLRCTNVI